jgi:uncharacterized membrane protein
MLKYLAGYGGAALAFVILDGLWLALIAPRIYKPILGDLLTGQVRAAPAVAFYVLFVLGVVVLAVRPALKSGVWSEALVLGLILGAVAYGAYDLTNHATLRVWSLKITLADMIWGSLASGVGAVAGFYAARLVTK